VSFFFEPFDALESEFQFVLLNAFFDIVLSVTQHAVNQPCQMVGHGHDCLWRAKSGSQAPVFSSQRAFRPWKLFKANTKQTIAPASRLKRSHEARYSSAKHWSASIWLLADCASIPNVCVPTLTCLVA
jgi:hypothetical protein